MKLESYDYFTSNYPDNIKYILQVIKITDLGIHFKYIAKYNVFFKTFDFFDSSNEHITYLIENYHKLNKDVENQLCKELVFR